MTNKIITFILWLSVISPILMGLIYFKKLSKPEKFLLFIILVGFAFDILSLIVSLYLHKNLFLLHFYDIIEFPLIVYLYKTYDNKVFKKMKINYIVLFYILSGLVVYFSNSIGSINRIASIHGIIGEILIIIFSFIFLLQFSYETDVLIIHKPKFWIVTSFLVYNVGNIIINVLSMFIDPMEMNYLYFVNSFFSLVSNGLFTIAFIVQKNYSFPNKTTI